MVAIGTKSGIEPITCAVVGALLGFLLFNVYPASVFMGDTGSLALGGFVASAAYMLQMPIFIIIVGFIYLIEVLSVMIQVTYFKKTGGKRFFKMAPIHHHFELLGWSESKVVVRFWMIEFLFMIVGLMMFYVDWVRRFGGAMTRETIWISVTRPFWWPVWVYPAAA